MRMDGSAWFLSIRQFVFISIDWFALTQSWWTLRGIGYLRLCEWLGCVSLTRWILSNDRVTARAEHFLRRNKQHRQLIVVWNERSFTYSKPLWHNFGAPRCVTLNVATSTKSEKWNEHQFGIWECAECVWMSLLQNTWKTNERINFTIGMNGCWAMVFVNQSNDVLFFISWIFWIICHLFHLRQLLLIGWWMQMLWTKKNWDHLSAIYHSGDDTCLTRCFAILVICAAPTWPIFIVQIFIERITI